MTVGMSVNPKWGDSSLPARKELQGIGKNRSPDAANQTPEKLVRSDQ
jgi:hypothetical protein